MRIVNNIRTSDSEAKKDFIWVKLPMCTKNRRWNDHISIENGHQGIDSTHFPVWIIYPTLVETTYCQ